MTSWSDKKSSERIQRIKQQKDDYDSWLSNFKNKRAWTYFESAFSKYVGRGRWSQLTEEQRKRLRNEILVAIFFSIRSEFKNTFRYKESERDQYLMEDARELLDTIEKVQTIRARHDFKKNGVDLIASADMYCLLNNIPNFRGLTLEQIDNNPSKYIDGIQSPDWDNTFEIYKNGLKEYLNKKGEFHFRTFHCLSFDPPRSKSSIKSTVNSTTVLMIFIHDLLSRARKYIKTNEYPSKNNGSKFLSYKGVGWTVPAKLVLAAIEETEVINDTDNSSKKNALEKLKNTADSFVKSHPDFTMTGWVIWDDHSRY